MLFQTVMQALLMICMECSDLRCSAQAKRRTSIPFLGDELLKGHIAVQGCEPGLVVQARSPVDSIPGQIAGSRCQHMCVHVCKQIQSLKHCTLKSANAALILRNTKWHVAGLLTCMKLPPRDLNSGESVSSISAVSKSSSAQKHACDHSSAQSKAQTRAEQVANLMPDLQSLH